MHDKDNEPDVDYCPVCNFELSGEIRGCTPFCTNCGWKGVCGDPMS